MGTTTDQRRRRNEGLSRVFLRHAVAVLAVACATAPVWAQGSRHREPIQVIEPAKGLNPTKVKLGRDLFVDARLSRDGTVSCASCHSLSNHGVDGVQRSFGVGGQRGLINAPTVFNSSLNFVQFWDGRAADLHAQVTGPIHNPLEMATDWASVVRVLTQDARLVARFANIYPEGLTAHTVTDAIVEFEKALVTPSSPFDRYLKGDRQALTSQQVRGYELFKDHGCAACHQGRNVGGNMYEKLGVFHNYFTDRGHITPADYGRFNQTGLEMHRFEFKVPSLRSVAHTAPYFHDGSVSTLDEAVRLMAWYQLGRKLPKEDVTDIVAFLKSLSALPAEALLD